MQFFPEKGQGQEYGVLRIAYCVLRIAYCVANDGQ